MKPFAFLVFLVGMGQEREREVTPAERTRFLFQAAFDGLIEDGAQEEAVRSILGKRTEWFVAQCPICDAVLSGFQAYLTYAHAHGWKTDRKDGLPDWFGPGWPKETIDGLNDPDLKKRHGALQALVDRHVSRRFDQVRMSDGRRIRLQESIKIGMGEGLKRLKQSGDEALFPASCPSCEGAN